MKQKIRKANVRCFYNKPWAEPSVITVVEIPPYAITGVDSLQSAGHRCLR